MILKIVSGGQTGADRAALDLAIKLDLPHGGWVPKGRIAEDGRIPDKYNVQEMSTDSYPARTEQNVLDSDGTLIISHGKLTGGSKLTQDLAHKRSRPCLHMDIHKTPQFLAALEINQWVIDNQIETLNVAGPKESGNPKIYGDTTHILESAIVLGMTAPDQRDQMLRDQMQRDQMQRDQIRDSANEGSGEKLPVPPRTIDDAVSRLRGKMSLKDKVTVANMGEDELASLDRNLETYIKNTFRMSHNTELMEACRSLSPAAAMDEDDASAIIIRALRKELSSSHRLRVVK